MTTGLIPTMRWEDISLKQVHLAGGTDRGKDGRCATLENSPNFPLSHSLDGGENSIKSSLSNLT